MQQTKKVTIYTQAYKTEPFLKQCIESVLAQTYTNFEYILVDNASLDRCGEMIDYYASLDQRIKPIHLTENQGIRGLLTVQYGTGDYYTVIDSDDWWEHDYLERLIGFLEENDLDLAITGTITHFEHDGSEKVLRKLNSPLVLTRQQFVHHYPELWMFPSTTWGNIMKMELFQRSNIETIRILNIPYGSDTLCTLKYLELCKKIGIDNSAMYHYRIRPKSVSYIYNSRRFDGNIIITETIREFLEQHNTFDVAKQEWLKHVHISAMNATMDLLGKSDLSVSEKLAECARIASHPLTSYALNTQGQAQADWHQLMRTITATAVLDGAGEIEDLRSVLSVVAPRFVGVTEQFLPLFHRESRLLEIVLSNDWEGFVSSVFQLIAAKRYTKQVDLGAVLGAVIPERTILSGMTDTRFFRTYSDVCLLILSENYAEALEQMTTILLEQERVYGEEVFLAAYLSVAALENQIPAFLYGKIRLAALFLDEGRIAECKDILNELSEMGAGDHEDVLLLKEEMERLL